MERVFGEFMKFSSAYTDGVFFSLILQRIYMVNARKALVILATTA